MKKQLNIALISPSKNAYSETFIQMHKKGLKGNVVYYFGGYLPNQNDKDSKLSSSFLNKVFVLKNKLELSTLSVKEQVLKSSFTKYKIDVVVAEYGPTATAVLPICKALNLPLLPVFHGYDASIQNVLNQYESRYKELITYCKKVLVVSSKIAQTITELGCGKEKIVITPCAPNDDFFNVQPKFDSQNFVSVGRFVEKKAPLTTIKAFQEVVEIFPEATLHMVGEGELLEKCKEFVNENNLSRNIIFYGKQSSEKIKELLAQSIGFLQHSIVAKNGDSEGTPVSILEASAAGLPIISTFHAGIPDVVKHNETGFLVNEKDVSQMSKYIIELIEDVLLAKKMGQLGEKFVLENFSQSKHLDILNSIIQNIVNG